MIAISVVGPDVCAGVRLTTGCCAPLSGPGAAGPGLGLVEYVHIHSHMRCEQERAGVAWGASLGADPFE
jgi:hypothetical protein